VPTPAYLHLPLAVDTEGRKLSKSSDAPSIDAREPGATLARALRFLGQPGSEIPDIRAMLRLAADRLDLSALHDMTARPADESQD